MDIDQLAAESRAALMRHTAAKASGDAQAIELAKVDLQRAKAALEAFKADAAAVLDMRKALSQPVRC
jgi:hypothetical protein